MSRRKNTVRENTLTGPGATKDGESGKPCAAYNPSASEGIGQSTMRIWNDSTEMGGIHWFRKRRASTEAYFESDYEGRSFRISGLISIRLIISPTSH